MSFELLSLDVVEHCILPYVPLIDLWKLQPESKMFRERFRKESRTLHPWIDAVERDDVEFLSLLEKSSVDRHLTYKLAEIAFAENKLNIMEYIFATDRSCSSLYLCICLILTETLITLPDKHFASCVQYINLFAEENFIPEHLAEPFLQRLSSLRLRIVSKSITLNADLEYRYSNAIGKKKGSRFAPPRLKDPNPETVESFRAKVQHLEKNRYDPRSWTGVDKELLLYVDINPDIIFPKLLSSNPSSLSMVVRSNTVPNLFWLEKYLSMKVEGVSVLAYLLANLFDWVDILCLEAASNVENLHEDLLQAYTLLYPGSNHLEWIQDKIAEQHFPLWFTKLFW